MSLVRRLVETLWPPPVDDTASELARVQQDVRRLEKALRQARSDLEALRLEVRAQPARPRMGLVEAAKADVKPQVPTRPTLVRLGRRLEIDRDECIGCGTCVEHEAAVFELRDAEGKAYVRTQHGNPQGIEDAIDACPVTCIAWQAEPSRAASR